MNNKSTITVSVDASYKEGKAACAYYIKHECFVVKDSEYIGKVSGSVEAEYLGILRAIKRMLLEIRDRNIITLYLTCDCIPAHELFRSWLTSSENRASMKPIKNINIQHIDAHSGINSPRQYINNWCDKESRKCLNDNMDL
jgi:hypothetical protein